MATSIVTHHGQQGGEARNATEWPTASAIHIGFNPKKQKWSKEK